MTRTNTNNTHSTPGHRPGPTTNRPEITLITGNTITNAEAANRAGVSVQFVTAMVRANQLFAMGGRVSTAAPGALRDMWAELDPVTRDEYEGVRR